MFELPTKYACVDVLNVCTLSANTANGLKNFDLSLISKKNTDQGKIIKKSQLGQ
jgi:hypothetical protein